MSDSIVLPDLRFKGDRTYIHGTDLFQSVYVLLGRRKTGFLKEMSFRLFGNKQCAIQFYPPDSSSVRVVSQGRWHDLEENKDLKFWVVEQGDFITEHYEFDEHALCSGAQIDKEEISRQFNSSFTMIENIVALTKKLHYAKFPIPSGKWVFGQIVMNERLPRKCGRIKIENSQNIKNRFSRNRIILDGNNAGEIRFIVAENI